MAQAPAATVLTLMVEDITQDSDIVWGIEDPQTDAEWQVFDDAAARLIESFRKVEAGLAGPNDKTWAADEKFKAYLGQEYAALEQVRRAVAARDLDGVFDAGNELYTPCEECHLEFNPAVTDEQD
jgi:cytochrome c556